MTIDFNNVDIFNKEDSQYDNSNYIDNYTYNNILDKLIYAVVVSNEELNYVCKLKKYKINTKEELREIIKKYSGKYPIGSLNWLDVSEIKDMSFLFYRSKYNGDISKWNVSNVTNMAGMFAESEFDHDISDWDVSNVKSMAGMFAESPLKKIPWDDVSNVPIKDHMLG